MKSAKRETKAKTRADAQTKRAADRARHERTAFAKKLEAAKNEAQTQPAPGIVDDDEGASDEGS